MYLFLLVERLLRCFYCLIWKLVFRTSISLWYNVMKALFCLFLAASVDKSTAPSEPTKPAAPEMAAPVPTTQVPPSQTKQAPQGMPSLQARQPRPAGLGAGGLPPRPASARPSGMGGGLPPRPGAMGLRPPGNPPRPQMPNPLVHMVNPALNPPVEEPAEVQEARAKLMNIRLLMLRLASRLELPPIDLAVQEVMNKIDMAERLRYEHNRSHV